MFNIIQNNYHVYYPGGDTIYLNDVPHNVPKKVRGSFPYLTFIDGEVFINGYVYNESTKTWHMATSKTIITIVSIILFVIFIFTIFSFI